MRLDVLRELLAYSDWANQAVFEAAEQLTDAQLDQPIEMGPGSLRCTLLHIYAGEYVWLRRWQGQAETPWIDQSEAATVATIQDRLRTAIAERDTFLATLADNALARLQDYRDSKGEVFSASLGDMMTQMIIHSTHHRAQAVNMLRRVGAGLVELDYMYQARKPAQTTHNP